MFYHQLTFVIVALLISGVLLLTVDTKIYAVNAMHREKKFAKVIGWIYLSLFLLIGLAQLFYL
ncbi:putative membrane protein affecting hemolysin expression [Paenibacillus sp. PastF-3]|uniref:CLC_0170 family protein n=1 Tax=Paenibacillus TaxID=44249 RepID=UPI002474428C|nr:CLC_0170 family protein [Paenibacillus sp. PastF-3]MDH6374224.1 putative membrane protein affecting hemolysin expression [Paenibacillus sp. PastF-3]